MLLLIRHLEGQSLFGDKDSIAVVANWNYFFLLMSPSVLFPIGAQVISLEFHFAHAVHSLKTLLCYP